MPPTSNSDSDIEGIALDEVALRQVIDAAPNGMLMVNQEGLIVLVNTQLERLFLYTRNELIGRSVETLVPQAARHQHPEHRKSFHSENQARAMGAGRDLYGLRKDGTMIPVEIGLNPLETAYGRFVVASVVDISERKRAEQLLKDNMLELQQSNEDLQQFAYVCSHDLQEPLRVISNYTQLIARRYKGSLDQNADDFIEFITDATRRMQELINDLLLFSRVNTRAQSFRETDCNLVLKAAAANLQIAFSESGAELTCDELPSINGDGPQITQLFQNLLGNAIKFRSDQPPHIHVSATDEGKSWRFTVHDNGIGFDMKYADRVFVIFQRLHTREVYPGSGIGLAICKKIVERHGGEIKVNSAPGKGTEFIFDIPKDNHKRDKTQ